ncbi:hypothetical protein OSM86_25620, partial [Escherichia coli]|nr:hypothetical protein [Escherichia coli]
AVAGIGDDHVVLTGVVGRIGGAVGANHGIVAASGPLVIHKPQQNVYIDGGPGSGKSESWITHVLPPAGRLALRVPR